MGAHSAAGSIPLSPPRHEAWSRAPAPQTHPTHAPGGLKTFKSA